MKITRLVSDPIRARWSLRGLALGAGVWVGFAILQTVLSLVASKGPVAFWPRLLANLLGSGVAASAACTEHRSRG